MGPSYSTVAKFPEDGEHWEQEAWSVIATFSNPSQAIEHIAEIEFLAESPPHERLIPGGRFELYEGARLVAVVNLIG
jgi:hypothetical protein